MSEQKTQQPPELKSADELSEQDLEKVSGGAPPKTSTTIGSSGTTGTTGSGIVVNTQP